MSYKLWVTMASYSVTFHTATVNTLAKANIRLLVSFRALETQMVPQKIRKVQSSFQRLTKRQRSLLIIMWHKWIWFRHQRNRSIYMNSLSKVLKNLVKVIHGVLSEVMELPLLIQIVMWPGIIWFYILITYCSYGLGHAILAIWLAHIIWSQWFFR